MFCMILGCRILHCSGAEACAEFFEWGGGFFSLKKVQTKIEIKKYRITNYTESNKSVIYEILSNEQILETKL